MLAKFMPPDSDRPLESDVSSGEELDRVLAQAADRTSDRGIPAVELTGHNGSTLAICQTPDGTVLMLVDPLGESMHSVGEGLGEDTVAFDYFGSYTEVPSAFTVPAALARGAARAFLHGDDPASAGVSFEPD